MDKVYKLPFEIETTDKGFVKLAEAFLMCGYYKPEVNFMNPDCGEPRPGYIFPEDIFLTYTDKNINYDNMLKDFLKTKREFTCVASIDSSDNDRLSMLVIPSNELSKGCNVAVRFFTNSALNHKNELFNRLEKNYNDLMLVK